jgi:hypothetical protein
LFLGSDSIVICSRKGGSRASVCELILLFQFNNFAIDTERRQLRGANAAKSLARHAVQSAWETPSDRAKDCASHSAPVLFPQEA